MRTSPSQIAITLLAVVAFGMLGAWLFPGKQPARRRIPPPLPEAALDNKPTVEAGPSGNSVVREPASLSKQTVLELIAAYSLPKDPDRPPQMSASEDAALRNVPDTVVDQVLEIGPSVIGDGYDRRLYELNLGRLALAHHKDDLAYQYLTDSAGAGSAAAKAYLCYVNKNPKERFALLDEAISGGFTPAKEWKKKLESDSIKHLDEQLAHPGDPQKPAEIKGVTDESLRLGLSHTKFDEIVTDYGEFAKAQTRIPRLCFEIGRAAYWKKEDDAAEEYLAVAAGLGSAGAKAYLTMLPNRRDDSNSPDNFEKNTKLLTDSAKGNFKPADLLFSDHMRNDFDPHAPKYSAAEEVLKVLYNGDIKSLLSGSIFFDPRVVDVGGTSKELFVRPMLLEYMAAILHYPESQEPAYLNNLDVVMSIVNSGRAPATERKLDESLNGFFLNNQIGGAVFAGQKAASGDLGALLRSWNPGQDWSSALKQRREQIKKMGENHARFLFTSAKGGNPKPIIKIYNSALKFVDEY